MQGRLQGKRLHGRYFVDHVVGHGTEGCNYLLAVDVDMNTVDGYAISSWERGYGDMEFVLDDRTIRLLTHLPATAMIQCDLVWPDHSPVVQSPRSILQRQLDRCAERGWTALAGTELEFIAFDTTYEQAATDALPGPDAGQPVQRRLLDPRHHAGRAAAPRRSATTCTTPASTSRAPRASATSASTRSASSTPTTLITADNHAVYKTAAKEIAAQQGKSITFMAKYNEREGNSCHIHLSLRGTDGELVFWDDEQGRAHAALRPASSPACWRPSRDFTLLYAPNINSYKRFADGSFAPTTIAWGLDNRTCAIRLVGRGAGARMENRVPGGDVNPYLALAAMLAGGLHGIENELRARGRRWSATPTPRACPRCRRTMPEARERFAASASRGRRSATRSSTTTSTWPTSSWPPTTPPSPTGSCAAASKGSDPHR